MSVKAMVQTTREGAVQAAFESGRSELVGWVQRTPRRPSAWQAIRDGGRVITSTAKTRREAVAALLAYVGIEAA